MSVRERATKNASHSSTQRSDRPMREQQRHKKTHPQAILHLDERLERGPVLGPVCGFRQVAHKRKYCLAAERDIAPAAVLQIELCFRELQRKGDRVMEIAGGNQRTGTQRKRCPENDKIAA